jgi:glycosyltransferase involved in cell wall biosynthesis
MIARIGRSIARHLLPDALRGPVANHVYALIAWYRRVVHQVRYALSPGDSNLLRRIAGRAWHGLSHYRALIACEPASLGWTDRTIRTALLGILATPDPLYRRILARIKPACAGGLTDAARGARSGIAMMIGALGPGGAERQVALTLTGLAGRGIGPLSIRCSFLRNDTERFFVPLLEPAGVSVAELDPSPGQHAPDAVRDVIRSLPPSLRDLGRYLCSLQTLNPQVVHLWLDEVNIKGGIAAVLAGVPRIVLGMRSLPPINFAFHQPYMREGYRWLAKRPEVTLVNNSAAGARAYEAWLGLAPGSIRILHNGFDFDPSLLHRHRESRKAFRRQHGFADAAPVLGTVIRLSEEKRPLLWLEIAARVRAANPQARFLLVGDGPMRARVEERVRKPDLDGAVVLTGHHRHPLTTIAAMDLFLLTSRAEGLPNVLVESQAMGVPVVTMNVGGAPETLSDRATGWLLDGDDPGQAARTISGLLADQAWLASAGAAAPAFVRNAFGIERMLDETISLYALQDEH